jgi:hypothetical protein
VTEPVARTSVRRTVRVAVALVLGQALLCALIGWLTFGSGHAHPRGPVPTSEPLAGKPLVIPPPVVVPPPRPPRPSAEPSVTKKVRTASPSERPSTRPPSSPTSTPARSPVRQASPTGQPALALPTPPTADPVQSPVKVLDVCAPEDAIGLTAEGVPVTCVLGRDGNLRWQIN